MYSRRYSTTGSGMVYVMRGRPYSVKVDFDKHIVSSKKVLSFFYSGMSYSCFDCNKNRPDIFYQEIKRERNHSLHNCIFVAQREDTKYIYRKEYNKNKKIEK